MRERGRESEREGSHWKEKRSINSQSLDLNFNGDLWDSKEKHCACKRTRMRRWSATLSLSLSHSHMNEGQAKSQALKPFDVLPELSWHQQQ